MKKRIMKKILLGVMTIGIFALVGCGNETAEESKDVLAESKQETTKQEVTTETTTQKATEATTEKSTAVENKTEAPTEATTEKPTAVENKTEAPTKAPTIIPTEAPTIIPTVVPTQALSFVDKGVCWDYTTYMVNGKVYALEDLPLNEYVSYEITDSININIFGLTQSNITDMPYYRVGGSEVAKPLRDTCSKWYKGHTLDDKGDVVDDFESYVSPDGKYIIGAYIIPAVTGPKYLKIKRYK